MKNHLFSSPRVLCGWVCLGLLMSGGAMATEFELVTERDVQAQLVHVTVTVNQGSLSDPTELPGLANFTARAALRGTRTRPFKDFTDSMERLGGSLSVSVDQTTTTFQGTVLLDNLDFFLDLLRDVFSQPAFEVQELITLKGILQGELASELQDVRTVARRALLGLIYGGAGADHPPLGTVAGIQKIGPREVADFFKTHYVTGNVRVGISSPFEDTEITRRVRTKLSSIADGARSVRELPSWSFKGRRAVIVDRKGMETTATYVTIPGVSDADPALPALEAANFMFGGDFTSRLMQLLRAQKGWTYGVRSGFETALRAQGQPGVFGIYLFPSSQFATEAVRATWTELEKYSRDGLSSDEWSAAREALVRRYAFESDTVEKRLASKLRFAHTGRVVLSPEQYAGALNGLSLANVNALIAQKHPLETAAIAMVGDAAVLRPVLKALPQFDSVEVVEVKP